MKFVLILGGVEDITIIFNFYHLRRGWVLLIGVLLAWFSVKSSSKANLIKLTVFGGGKSTKLTDKLVS